MPPSEALRQQVEEYGARALLDELDEKRAELIDQYPFLAGVRGTGRVRTHNADVTSLLEQAREFTSKANHRPKTKRERRLFDEAFKEAAIARVAGGEFLADVARAERVWPSVLASWCRKKGVKIPKMSREEQTRRMHSNGQFALPPPPPPSEKRSKAAPAAAKRSHDLALRVLQSMPDNGEAMHYLDIAKTMGHDPMATNWLIRVRRENGHIKFAGAKQKGMYIKTEKGMKWQQEQEHTIQ